MHTRIKQVLARKGHDVHAVPAETCVTDAAQKMAELAIGSVLVELDDQVVGILTERDLARRVCCRGNFDLSSTPVSDVMTSPLACVTPAVTVAEAMKVMAETHCRHLPVVAEGRLVGLVSIGDLVRSVTADLAADVEYLQDYIVRG